jgi:hypothetical protein
MLKEKFMKENALEHESLNFCSMCRAEILMQLSNVSACLATAPSLINYILYPLLEIECEQGISPVLGGVGEGGRQAKREATPQITN